MNKNVIIVENPIFYINMDNPYEVIYFRSNENIGRYKLVLLNTYLTEPKLKYNQILYKKSDNTNRYYIYNIPFKNKLENILNR